jgi:PAS domain S-box-containing protein
MIPESKPDIELASGAGTGGLPPARSRIEPGHVVQFYENDQFLAAAVCDFLADGLTNGQKVLVVATEEHRVAFERRLNAKGLDAERALRLGHLTVLDARETLRMFMVGTMPDRDRFMETLSAVIHRTRGTEDPVGLRIYGEMVDVLWQGGNTEGALRLEELWNELSAMYPFNLLCAYSMGNFYKAADAASFREVCRHHSHVVPTERYTMADEAGRALEVVRLQQRERALETEILHRAEIEERLRDALLAARRAEDALRESERQLADFFENSIVPMQWVRRDGTILRANAAELDLLGYEFAEYVGHRISEFQVDDRVVEDMLARLSRGETLSGREMRLRRKDGGTRDVIIDSNVYWGPDGEFVHARFVTRDVTELKAREEARARLAAIVTSSDDAIVGKTLDGVITSWNPGAERIFGYTAAEAVGRHITLIIPAERRAEEDHVLAQLRRGLRVDHFETVRQAKDGRKINVSLTVSPITDSSGKIIGASKIARDITAQLQTRRELEEARKSAEEARLAAESANRAKAEFLASMSHELRTPLNAIGGYVQLLAMEVHGPVTDRQREALHRIEKAGQYLLSLINDVLNFAKLEAGKVEYEISSVRLRDAVTQVSEIMEQQMAGKGLTFAADVDPAIVVRADPEKLNQVLLNLMSNAVKFTPAGGRLSVRSRANGEKVVTVAVCDTGPGIPPEKRNAVFEPFVQLHQGRVTRAQGTGLGLSISRDLARGMGGDLRVDPDYAGGAGFLLTLAPGA